MLLSRRAKAAAIVATARLLRVPMALASRGAAFPDAPRRILVLKPCCLGDVLLATPAIAALRRRFPDARLDVAVGRFARVMVENNPRIDHLIDCGRVGWGKPYPLSEYLDLVRRVRRERYDVCFVLDRSPATAAIAALAGIPVRVGIDSGGRGFSLTHATQSEPVRHEAELYLDTLRAAGIDPGDERMEFFPTSGDRARAGELLAPLRSALAAQGTAGGTWSGRVIALHPGGGENPGMTFFAKRWAPDGFATVARTILAGAGGIVLVGAANERDVNDAVLARLGAPHERLLDLTGRTSLSELGAVLEACDAFLGNDSGPMHLACAVGTPTVAVFGPSNPVMYRPYVSVGALVYRRVACSPCLRDGLYRFAPDCVHQCMTGIAAEEPLAALQQIIGRQAPVGD